MYSLYSMWLIFGMRELGENEALLVKQVDSGIKCSWSGLKGVCQVYSLPERDQVCQQWES